MWISLRNFSFIVLSLSLLSGCLHDNSTHYHVQQEPINNSWQVKEQERQQKLARELEKTRLQNEERLKQQRQHNEQLAQQQKVLAERRQEQLRKMQVETDRQRQIDVDRRLAERLQREENEKQRQIDEDRRLAERLQREENERQRHVQKQIRKDEEYARQLDRTLNSEAQNNALPAQPIQPQAQPARPQVPSAPADAGVPEVREGDVVKAGQLLMELRQQRGGGMPSQADMLNYLTTQMHISEDYARRILDALDI